MQFKVCIKGIVLRVQAGRIEPLGAWGRCSEDAGMELDFEDKEEGCLPIGLL